MKLTVGFFKLVFLRCQLFSCCRLWSFSTEDNLPLSVCKLSGFFLPSHSLHWVDEISAIKFKSLMWIIKITDCPWCIKDGTDSLEGSIYKPQCLFNAFCQYIFQHHCYTGSKCNYVLGKLRHKTEASGQ